MHETINLDRFAGRFVGRTDAFFQFKDRILLYVVLMLPVLCYYRSISIAKVLLNSYRSAPCMSRG